MQAEAEDAAEASDDDDDDAAMAAAEGQALSAAGTAHDDEDEEEEDELGVGRARLFGRQRLFLSREVNVEVLLFVLRACGAANHHQSSPWPRCRPVPFPKQLTCAFGSLFDDYRLLCQEAERILQAGFRRVFSDGCWGSGVAGAKASSVGWDGAGSPFDSNDAEITHEVVDRPSQKKRILSREYVQ